MQERAMEKKIREVLEKAFDQPEVQQLIDFLERGFTRNGQIVIASVFLYAREKQVAVAEMIEAVEAEWQRNWSSQHPELRADPDAPGGAGLANRISILNINRALDLSSPGDAPTAAR
jgi:hypothetical protein